MHLDSQYNHKDKVYVDVSAVFHADGRIEPKSFIWEDGHTYDINAVVGVCPAASLKTGGCGIRYTCRVMGRSISLYLEDNSRWFMERK